MIIRSFIVAFLLFADTLADALRPPEILSATATMKDMTPYAPYAFCFQIITDEDYKKGAELPAPSLSMLQSVSLYD